MVTQEPAETRRSSSHHNAPEDAAHALSLPLSFYSRDPRVSEQLPQTPQLLQAVTPLPKCRAGFEVGTGNDGQCEADCFGRYRKVCAWRW